MERLNQLTHIIQSYRRLCVAFSGGVDSALLLKAAVDAIGENAFAIIANGAMLPKRELAAAQKLASTIGANCLVLDIDPFSVPEFQNNGPWRCYYCKKHIFEAIIKKASFMGATHVADGKNTDDENAHRPGTKALNELGILSPLCEAGFSKSDVRQTSKYLGLSVWDKPSASCLATRLPYNTTLTPLILHNIEQAEYIIEDCGIKGCRARVHGEILRIETPPHYFRQLLDNTHIIEKLKALGFKYITLDMEGFRSGSMD